ncbi:MAG: family 43 glycosylhydrolase, partial [Bacteroidetes bacterium]|nr:family 43 glycosylhydrolase [Bacteroidota bacterium]
MEYTNPILAGFYPDPSICRVGEDYYLVNSTFAYFNGGTDVKEKPVWIEGPHIFKVDDYYYLICAQGGTAENHSEVVFRSKDVWGPYVSYEENPILTQRDLNPDRKDPITCTGHADFVETQKGTWWAVFLGCQTYPPYANDNYNTGRETFLAPVTWKDGWPIIIPHGQEVAYYYPYPLPPAEMKDELHYGGDIECTDNFDSKTLDLNWEFLRAP